MKRDFERERGIYSLLGDFLVVRNNILAGRSGYLRFSRD